VREICIGQKRFLRPQKFYNIYEVLWHVQGDEWQVINFHRSGSDWSINHLVTADMAAAYLYGVLAGLHHPLK